MDFDRLVVKLTPTLKRITHRLNGHFTFMDEDDLYQEALLHLWLEHREGRLDDKTESYMLQGCYFSLKNYIRKVQDRAVIVSLSSPIDDEGTLLEELLLHDDAPFDYVESRMDVEKLEEQGMTEREKEVLAYTIEGLTTREIGDRLGISHVSVLKIRNKIRDAYERLHRYEGRRGYQM